MLDEATTEFIIETREGLDQLDREFIALEADPRAKERIATVFRTIHTIKGTAAFLGLSRLEKLAHVAESLLALVRDGSLQLNPQIAATLLAVVDRVRSAVTTIEATTSEGSDDHADLIARLQELRRDEPVVTQAAPAPVAAPIPSPAPEASPSQVGDNVRIDVRLLDNLMDIVGELVLARNQILQFGARVEDPSFVGASQRLSLITTELQEQVMKTRMQPIGTVWAKLPRVVRDLALACGKHVRVEMIGKETELDRTILEAVKDPLTHIVRNAIDHGLETPAQRASHGKPRTGTLTLRAFHAGGQVNIEVSDDGAGLDVEAIQHKAVERKLVTTAQAAALNEYELAQLVFLAGFSTAKQVTNVSGRGVGMDVVKTNIERIGGTVEIVTTRHVGTTIKIRIPLTLAIIPALIVAQGGQRYAIPQANLVELVRIEAAQVATAIEHVHGSPVYRLRGQLLPITYLEQVLELQGHARSGAVTELNIIVLQAEDRLFGVIIDEVRDTEEIVVKPLGKELKSIQAFAGATIMGDGRVALILDVQAMSQHAGLGRDRGDRDVVETKGKGPVAEVSDLRQTLLLFTIEAGTTVAIPLSSVARLEEFATHQLERGANCHVVQHRGSILPLIDLAGVDSSPVGQALPVIVYAEATRSIGLVVRKILDVVEQDVRVERIGGRSDSFGAAVVQGKVTDLLDLESVIRRHAPWFFTQAGASV